MVLLSSDEYILGKKTRRMNLMLQLLSEEEIELQSDQYRVAVEDNVGEAIHIHINNFRLEMPVEDYMTFADEVKSAVEVLHNGNC
jgi:hypothetical protein